MVIRVVVVEMVVGRCGGYGPGGHRYHHCGGGGGGGGQVWW